MSGERKNVLGWDAYFMAIAILSSMRSKDPRTQVGSCIVDKNKRLLSVGYNGTVSCITDEEMPWDSLGEETNDIMHIKNTFVVHAEANALENYYGDKFRLEDGTLYVTLFPCMECTKKIVNSGIKRIVYLKMYSKKDEIMASTYMLRKANISVERFSDIVNIKSMLEQISMYFKDKLEKTIEDKTKRK